MNNSNNKKIVLSLILCSRNDGYMGDPVWRLGMALNYVAEAVHLLGKEGEVEIIVTDWGSETPLNTVTKLTSIASNMVSFLTVPQPLAKELQKDSHFSEVHALNAAAKRAKGEFVGRIDQDTLVGGNFLKKFFEWHEGEQAIDFEMDQVVFFANRKSIPYRYANFCPQYQNVKHYINVFKSLMKTWKHNPHTKVFWTSYVGICLFHKNLWEECGGYDETLIYYDWMEVDLLLRLKKKYPIVNLGEMVDYDFYHLDHYQLHKSWSSVLHPRTSASKSNDYILDLENLPDEINKNPNGWGMTEYDLTLNKVAEVDDKIYRSSFSAKIKFPFLLLKTVAMVIFDALNSSLYAIISPLPRFYWPIRRRVIQSWQIVRQNSAITWPRLIFDVWLKNKRVG